MSLVNTWKFTRTVIDCDKFIKATHNQYRVVSVKEYVDTKHRILPDGYILTLKVLKDDLDYGIDKNGVQRENNEDQNFDATVLNRNHKIKKGDYVSLLDFDAEHSYAIGFDLILRFKDYKVLQTQSSKSHA